MTDIYIIRHGNTFEAGEAPRRVGARTDIPLTVKGHEQAKALGEHFKAKGIQFSNVYSSPLIRAQQTAEGLRPVMAESVSLQKLEVLNEIDHGPDENLTEDKVIARIGEEAIRDWDEKAIPPKDWHVDSDKRLATWRQIFTHHLGHDLGVSEAYVTSNGAARFALLALRDMKFGLPELSTLKLKTGAYGHIRLDGEGAHFIDWNVRP